MFEYLWLHETISTIYYINILTDPKTAAGKIKLRKVSICTFRVCVKLHGSPDGSIGKYSLLPHLTLAILLRLWPCLCNRLRAHFSRVKCGCWVNVRSLFDPTKTPTIPILRKYVPFYYNKHSIPFAPENITTKIQIQFCIDYFDLYAIKCTHTILHWNPKTTHPFILSLRCPFWARDSPSLSPFFSFSLALAVFSLYSKSRFTFWFRIRWHLINLQNFKQQFYKVCALYYFSSLSNCTCRCHYIHLYLLLMSIVLK